LYIAKKFIMVNIEGIEIPNKLDELTVEQFDKLNNLEASKELDSVEKWLAKFEYLGVPEETFDDYDKEKFTAVINEWNVTPKIGDKVRSIVIDGFTYETKEIIGAKDLALIEKSYKKNLANFGADTLAILFKRTDLTRTEHYSNAHIKHKSSLFKKQKAELAVPYISEVIATITGNTETILNDSE